MPTYKVDFSGQTTGKSGKRIYFERNEPVECEKDDLKHLGDHVEMISKAKTAVVTKAEKREYPIHTHAGWYELSNGEKVRGKEEAIKAENEL